MKNVILVGDSLTILKTLPNEIVNTCITSPPYWALRDYGVVGQLGLEETPEQYIDNLLEVFREVRRVLKADGTLWVNIGDCYAANESARDKQFGNSEFNENRPSRISTRIPNKAIPNGIKMKDLVGIPWMLAFALRADGWYLRTEIIWNKPNAMPESVKDRPTRAHEYVFLLSKSPKYYYDYETVKEDVVSVDRKGSGNKERKQRPSHDAINRGDLAGSIPWTFAEKRNRRSVWTVSTKPYKGAHFAVFPPDLIEPCILAGCPEDGIVLDPFFGSGTTGVVSRKHNRNYIGIELNPEYAKIAEERINGIK